MLGLQKYLQESNFLRNRKTSGKDLTQDLGGVCRPSFDAFASFNEDGEKFQRSS